MKMEKQHKRKASMENLISEASLIRERVHMNGAERDFSTWTDTAESFSLRRNCEQQMLNTLHTNIVYTSRWLSRGSNISCRREA